MRQRVQSGSTDEGTCHASLIDVILIPRTHSRGGENQPLYVFHGKWALTLTHIINKGKAEEDYQYQFQVPTYLSPSLPPLHACARCMHVRGHTHARASTHTNKHT